MQYMFFSVFSNVFLNVIQCVVSIAMSFKQQRVTLKNDFNDIEYCQSFDELLYNL